MVKFELFVFKDADKTLDRKGQLQEIKNILWNVKAVDHKEIQLEFSNKGWILEKRIFSQTSWAWDAYKDKVAVSVELSLIDAVHRDFLRAILAHSHGDLDVLVYVTSTFKEPKFHNVKRDIGIFKEIVEFPILLVGCTRSSRRAKLPRKQKILDFSMLREIRLKDGLDITTFKCPFCGATLGFPKSGKAFVCRVCRNTIKPDNLRSARGNRFTSS